MIVKDDIIETVFTKLWLNYSMLAAIISRVGVDIVEKNDDAIAWTNGRSIFLNWTAIKERDFTYDNLVFIVAHEVMHLITLTQQRRQWRNQQFWNMATDYAINWALENNERDNRKQPVGTFPKFEDLVSPKNPNGNYGLLDTRFANMAAEEIYDQLIKDFQKENDGKTPDQAIDEAIKSFVNGLGKGDGQGFDSHEKLNDMTDEDTTRIKAKVEEVMRSMTGQEAGKMDSAIKRALDLLLAEPPFDWRGFLSRYLKAFIKSDFTWKHPSRRSCAIGCVLPGVNVNAHINLGIAIDTSGSIDDKEVAEFLSHIQKIMKSFKSFNIDVWCFSTKVHEDTLKTYNQFHRDIQNYKLNSFGGTEIASNFDWIKEKKKKYDAFICLTDGYDNIDDLRFDYCPVIWGIVGNDSFKNPAGVKNAKTMRIEF